MTALQEQIKEYQEKWFSSLVTTEQKRLWECLLSEEEQWFDRTLLLGLADSYEEVGDDLRASCLRCIHQQRLYPSLVEGSPWHYFWNHMSYKNKWNKTDICLVHSYLPCSLFHYLDYFSIQGSRCPLCDKDVQRIAARFQSYHFNAGYPTLFTAYTALVQGLHRACEVTYQSPESLLIL